MSGEDKISDKELENFVSNVRIEIAEENIRWLKRENRISAFNHVLCAAFTLLVFYKLRKKIDQCLIKPMS